MGRCLDYAVWPILFFGPIAGALMLLQRGVSDVTVTLAMVAVLGAIAWGLERVRPERLARSKPDFSLWMEVGHFLLGVELGYGLALLACEGVHRFASLSVWPVRWPVALQILLAVLIYEGASYWQHRCFHRSRRLWPFHALHHTGSRLDVTRALRFHAVDIALPTFVGYMPLVVMNAPERMFTLLGIIISTFGILQHANIRMRTPAWLDALLCTPVVHRQHHARDRTASECNYGTTVMVWDRLFGTYRRAERPDGPDDFGIEDDTVPRTFLRQLTSPFRGRRHAQG